MIDAELKLGDKLPAAVIGPFEAERLAAYAEVSGDSNPLHLDLSFARRFGFLARPVHGMRLLAAFEPLLNDWRPQLFVRSLRGQFLTPVLEGESALLSGRVAKIERENSDFVVVLRLMVHSQSGAPALMGEARLAARNGRIRRRDAWTNA
jgi:acyl dehydratase